LKLAQRSVGFVLAALPLTACAGGLSSTAGSSATPVPTMTSAHRDKTTIQYCVDDTGSYPRDDFRGANQLVAQNLVDAVAANSDALALYATLINSNAFDPASTLDPFQIPATAAYPTLPTPLPTPTEGNPISYAREKQVAQAKDDDTITAYNDQVAAVRKQLDDLKQQISADANHLVNLNPAVDHTATSVWGCLQLARTRFQQNPGTQYLVIASDLENTTSVDYTADFQETRA
jgi:hypothetical protein